MLVAAADDQPDRGAGRPVQPAAADAAPARDLAAGRGLTVTAANFADQRASFAGRGSQISLAAYGSFDDGGGPPGIFASFPGNPTELEARGSLLFPGRLRLPRDVRRRRALRLPAGNVDGGADRRGRRRDGARSSTPTRRAADIIRTLKETATRPAGSGWNADLGWGIVDAGAAMSAVRAIDRRAAGVQAHRAQRVRKARSVTLQLDRRRHRARRLQRLRRRRLRGLPLDQPARLPAHQAHAQDAA